MSLDVLPRRLSSTLLLIVVPATLAAQGRVDTVTVTPIVVTATRLPTPADAVAPTVTVLQGDALRAQGLATVADALRAVPGAAVEAGTYGARHGMAGVSGGGPGASYSVSLSRFSAAGLYPFNNRYRNDVFSGLVRVTPDPRTDATLSVRYTDDVYHFPTDGGGRVVDRNQFNFENGPTLGLDLGRFLTPRLEARLQLAASQADGGYEDPPDDPADTLGFYTTYRTRANLRRASAEVRVNVYLSPVSIVTLGAGTEQERERSINFCTGRFGDCSSPPVDTSRGNRAAYAQAVTDLGGRLSLNGGVRVEDNQRFGVFPTYRAGAVYRLTGATRLRVSLGTAFKEPTFFENYATGFVKGNPSLKPEQSRSGEIW